jgi:hypothetical protein
MDQSNIERLEAIKAAAKALIASYRHHGDAPYWEPEMQALARLVDADGAPEDQ